MTVWFFDDGSGVAAVPGDGVITLPVLRTEVRKKMDLPDGVGTLLLKSGTEAHIATMSTINNGIASTSETLRTMSNLKLNEVGPIEARSAGRILDGPFAGSASGAK